MSHISKDTYIAFLNIIIICISYINIMVTSIDIRRTKTLIDDRVRDILIVGLIIISITGKLDTYSEKISKYIVYLGLLKTGCLILLKDKI